jgi:RNA polymerase sigma-70 factor, ECF subfamily
MSYLFDTTSSISSRAFCRPAFRAPAIPQEDQAGETTLAEVYEKYSPAIFAHCLRFLPSSAAARDAAQEAFVRVLARGVVLSQEKEALRYLYSVSTNVCLNVLRQQKVRARAVPTLVANARHVGSAESGLVAREFVLEVLQRCGEKGTEVAIMHYLDGMSQVEIAAALGISRRSVFNRLRKVAHSAEELLHSAPRSQAATPGE